MLGIYPLSAINYRIELKPIYLLVHVFRASFRGARRPLAREPGDENLNDDITETNLSIDFSAMSE